ncbi:hypothetical protein [Paraburkholderia tagetis]|uniref:Uncharacterized protein n=1 Tax=Paraburkholderia tagetis TaxID=2913261 RepID=A0A9X1RLB7_9BURK|nr:hypothetical protein [Paraburkholderia tagetis]MCG5072254.1 hypothetical protein [Paraburkholderia tagetis]
MLEADFDPFVELLDAAYSLHGKTLPAMAKALFFRALVAHPLPVVRKAIDAHVKDSQRGQYAPKPADLIAQIEGAASNDMRPGPEEAWAIAVQAFDEDATVMLTDEISEAQGIARPIFELGDEVGARMAFREAYGRLVTQARAAGVAVKWWPSLGIDPDGRKEVLERAVAHGLLPANAPALSALPPPADAPLLETMIEAAAPTKADARETLDNLRKLLERDPESIECERLARVQRGHDATAARKQQLQRQADSRGNDSDSQAAA